MAERNRNIYIMAGVSCSVAATVCGALALSSRRTETAANRVMVSPANGVFDFGSVVQGDYSGTFVLHNPTAESVRIVGVDSSCGCTVANVSKDIIPSDESIELDFDWDTVGSAGPIRNQILIYFRHNDSSSPWSQQLSIVGDVLPEFEYSPSVLSFKADEDSAQTIQFFPRGDPDFKIRSAYCAHRAFAVDVDDTRRMLTVHFNSDRWREISRNVKVLVQTNGRMSSAGIPIRVDPRETPATPVGLSQ